MYQKRLPKRRNDSVGLLVPSQGKLVNVVSCLETQLIAAMQVFLKYWVFSASTLVYRSSQSNSEEKTASKASSSPLARMRSSRTNNAAVRSRGGIISHKPESRRGTTRLSTIKNHSAGLIPRFILVLVSYNSKRAGCQPHRPSGLKTISLQRNRIILIHTITTRP